MTTTAQTEDALLSALRHDPTWLHAGSLGRWCVCSCGWESRYGSINYAQDAFGKHLLDSRKETK